MPIVTWAPHIKGGAHPSPFAAICFLDLKTYPFTAERLTEFSGRRVAI